MRKLIICLGLSQSGKSTLGNFLSSDSDWYNFHVIEDLKRAQEKHFGYPEGYLDTTEGKESFVPGTEITNQSWMIDLFHFWNERVPNYSSFYIKNRLSELLIYTESSIFIQGVRQIHELKTIFSTINFYQEEYNEVWTLNTQILHLQRDSQKMESSDSNLQNLIQFSTSAFPNIINFDNSQDLSKLQKFADDIRWRSTHS
jgi:hypothetical protein